MKTDTQQHDGDAIASTDGLESVKRYNQFTWWHDRGMPRVETVIGDYDCNQITRFYRELSDEDVKMFCEGYETGWRVGVSSGRDGKAAEIRRVLGL